MRSSGPLRLSGYCGGRCWRLAWLRDAGRPRAEGRAAMAVRAAAAGAAPPRRRRALPPGPRRPRGGARGRPGPAGRRATAAAGRRPAARARNRALVAGVRAAMERRATARGVHRELRPPTHHAGPHGRPRPTGPGDRLVRRRAMERAGRPRPTGRAGQRAGRPRPTGPAEPAGIRLRTGRGRATGVQRRARSHAVLALAPPPDGAPGPSAAMDRGARARVQHREPGERREAPASSEGRGRGLPRAGTGEGLPAVDADPGTGLRRVRLAREAVTGTREAATGAPEAATGTREAVTGTREAATGAPEAATGARKAATGPPNARAAGGPVPPGLGPISPRPEHPGCARPAATARRTRAGHVSRTRSPLSSLIPRHGPSCTACRTT